MINADPQELAKFSELAHRWWDPESEFRPLHQINPLRLDWIDGLAPLRGKRVLDVGCGGGILAEAMARRGAEVLGIDLATKPLEGRAAARARGRRRRDVEYREVAVEALAAEHARRASTSSPAWRCSSTCPIRRRSCAPARRLRQARRLGRSSRRINRNPKAFVFAIVGAEYVLSLLPKGTHEYAKFIRPSELAALVPRRRARAGCARAAWNTTR